MSVLPVLPLAHGAEMKVCFVLCSHKQTEACVLKVLSAFFLITLMTGQIKDFIFNKKLHIAYVLGSHNCSNITAIADRVWINQIQVSPCQLLGGYNRKYWKILKLIEWRNWTVYYFSYIFVWRLNRESLDGNPGLAVVA